MSLEIGKKIKELRRAQGVTQEKLAEYLNISFQAVSRWETGLAFPDITLIPAIANFFGVSSDELLGMKGNEDAAELEAYEDAYKNNGIQGKVAEKIELCRKVLEKYPRNFKWMFNLADSLMEFYYHKYEGKYHDESKGIIEEVISLCERIREDCTDDSLRNSTGQRLVSAYSYSGKKDLALKIASEMPSMWLSSEILSSFAKEGEERVCQEQKNLMALIDLCDNSLRNIINFDEKLSPNEKISIYETQIKLFDLIFGGVENILFYNSRIFIAYYCLAEIYAGYYGSEYFDQEKSLKNLLLCEAALVRYDEIELGESKQYVPVWLNRQKTNPSNISKSFEGSMVRMMHHHINNDDGLFDKLRNHPDFVALMARLEAAK